MGSLVLLSLVLITVSFRSTALDGAQGTAAGILRPFEIGADRVARPFRDAVGWARGLVDAKSENAKLRRQNEALRQQVIQDESALQENVQLHAQIEYHSAPSEAAFRKVGADVLSNPQSVLEQSITIAAGANAGVQAGDVVRSPFGLVGVVDKAWAQVSRVTLLTDEQSAVTATDVTNPTTTGVVRRGSGDSNVLILDRVPKSKAVRVGDTIITAGSLGKGALPSMFPRGIPIGTVTSQSRNDVDPFMSIQVQPFVDFGSLQSVIVLVPRR